jgi:hypothetical protein
MAGDMPVYEKYKIIRKVGMAADTTKCVHPHEMLFTLPDLLPKPETYLGNYFGKLHKMHPVCALYFSTLYNPEMFLEQRFLSLAHAVEAYHRAMIGGKYLSDEEYESGLKQTFLNAIPETLDSGFKESLKGKLRYLHEFSLRKQIQDVASRLDEFLNRFLGDSKAFGARIAEKRNDLTHPKPDAIEAKDWMDLWLMSEQLSLLIVACLLYELGFPKDKLAVMLSRNKHAVAIHYNRK